MNFSTSSLWINSLALRYPLDKIQKIGRLYFYLENNLLKCQHFFSFDINDGELDELKKQISLHRKIRFNYLDDSSLLLKLQKWACENHFVYEVIDSWETPKLYLNDSISAYLKNNSNSQIKRNYQYYLKNKGQYHFYNSDDTDALKLWNYVLDIDFKSWKYQEHSDMKSLDREDLQYLPYLLINKKNSSLIVMCDKNDVALAYSLMFKSENDLWYAVKWGASTLGRKNYAGILCLFQHLEYLEQKDGYINLDFWGRRSQVYDYLKNGSIIRQHILIYQKEE